MGRVKCACGRILWYDVMRCPRCGRSTMSAASTLEAYGSEDEREWNVGFAGPETLSEPRTVGQTFRAELKRVLQGDIMHLLLPETFVTAFIAARRALKRRG